MLMQLSCKYMKYIFIVFAFFVAALGRTACAQESPFFVTYTHHMEEPGNLEVETSVTSAIPRSKQRFYIAPYMELEYGVTAQWTSELYLESDSAWGDSTVFTGWRIENRYKPMKREHWINPVLYFEYENVNEASRIQKEIEGGGPDLSSSHRELAEEHAHELETKLILSSDYRDWNISENFIATKNLAESEGVEFGYAFGLCAPSEALRRAQTVVSVVRTSLSARKCLVAWAVRLVSLRAAARITSLRFCRGRSPIVQVYGFQPVLD
jgi:hypothetical protein